MSGKRKTGKAARLDVSKPELPPFLQRMKQQIVDTEDAERRERSSKRRREHDFAGLGPRDPEDEPAVVKLTGDDLTEEEYKRMKRELETQYKLEEEEKKGRAPAADLDVDALIGSRLGASSASSSRPPAASSGQADLGPAGKLQGHSSAKQAAKKSTAKKLSYSSSSSSAADSD